MNTTNNNWFSNKWTSIATIILFIVVSIFAFRTATNTKNIYASVDTSDIEQTLINIDYNDQDTIKVNSDLHQ